MTFPTAQHHAPAHSMRAWLSGYAVAVALAIDRLLNALAGGSDRDTITARAARARDRGRWWATQLCRLLDKLDPGHCDREAARCNDLKP